MHVKEKSYNSTVGLQLCQKETPTEALSFEYSKSFRDSFFKEQLLCLLLNHVLVLRKVVKEKKVSGEIAFALISLFHIQIQKPTSRSTTLTAFVYLAKFAEFYFHKKSETRSP